MCSRLLQNVSVISYSHLQEVIYCTCGPVTFAVLFVLNKLICVCIERKMYNISIILIKSDEVYVPCLTLPSYQTPHCAVFLTLWLVKCE